MSAVSNPATVLRSKPEFAIPNWAIAVVLLFTALLYYNAVLNGFTDADDDVYILNNKYLRDYSWHGIKAIFSSFYSYNYHPLTTLTYWLEYHFFGLNPLPYHLFNVFFHLVNVWLVFLLVKLLSNNQFTAFLVSVLFAVHPMHVESVAWVSETKDVLYSAFYLLSLIYYLKYLSDGKKISQYLVCLGLFILSLFSKSAAVTLPVILILFDYYKGRTIDKKTVLEKVPFFILSAIFGIVTIMAQKAGGAINDLTPTYGIVNRVFIFTTGIASYFIKLVAPLRLSAFHFFPNGNNQMLPFFYYLSLPFLAALVWLVIRKSQYKKEFIFGSLFFLIAISLMLQIVTVGSCLFAERYTYISYIGLFYIFGKWLSDRVPNSKTIVLSSATILVMFFSYATYARISVWQDTDHLFNDAIEKNEGNWHNHYFYFIWGIKNEHENNYPAAIDYYTKVIQIAPENNNAFAARGKLYEKLNNYKSALEDYNKAISLKPQNANYRNFKGWVLFLLGDTLSAIDNFNMAMALEPTNAESYNNRGWVFFTQNKYDSAVADFNSAIAKDSLFAKPYFNRASIRARAGDFNSARTDYDLVIKHHPTDSIAYYNRGIVKYYLKDSSGACSDLTKSVELGNVNAKALLGQVCK